ncbi:MAG: hypothetical protein JWO38_345 [Gemmataceae bacterium]|nr:hypothetical protein [Gemmataceae bacterium]
MSRLSSPVWRLTHLYRFKMKEGGLKTFKPNTFQAQRYNRLYSKFHARAGHKEIDLKSRKFGTTTGVCFFCLDAVACRRNIEAVTMAHKSEKATEIFNMIVRPVWNEIPTQLRARRRFNNRNEIGLMESIRSKYIVSGEPELN